MVSYFVVNGFQHNYMGVLSKVEAIVDSFFPSLKFVVMWQVLLQLMCVHLLFLHVFALD